METIRGVKIPTLIRGTEAEEKDKALRSLEVKNLSLKKELARTKKQAKIQRKAIEELEKWTIRTFMAAAAVDIAIVIALFFALAK